MQTPARLIINICLPSKAAKVKTYGVRKINVLKTFFKQDFVFILNGEVLKADKTFDDYGVHSGDTIFAILPTQNPETWLRLSFDQDLVREKIEFASNENTRGEFARLRDLHLQRVEQKPKYIFKMGKTQKCTSPMQPGCPTTLSFERTLSIDPLPDPWNCTTKAPNSTHLISRQSSLSFSADSTEPAVL